MVSLSPAQATPAARPREVLTVGVERPRGRGGPVLGLQPGWGAAGGRYPRLGHDDGARRGWKGMVGVCDSAKRRAERRLLEAEGRNHRLKTEARREGGASCPRHGAAFFPARERPRLGLGAEAWKSDRWGRERRAGRRQPNQREERPRPEVPVSRWPRRRNQDTWHFRLRARRRSRGRDALFSPRGGPEAT